MKNFWSLIVLFICVFSLKGWSQNFLSNEHTAGGAFAFIEDFGGTVGMARAQTGVSTEQNDLFSTLLNPASPSPVAQKQNIAFSWKAGAVQSNQGSMAWAFPYKLARLQLTYNNHIHHNIAEYDIQGEATGHELKPYDQSLAFSVQVPTTHFIIGANFKHLLDRLSDLPQDQCAMAWGMDWGLRLRNDSPRWGAGIAVLNLGNQFRAYTEKGVNYLPLNSIIQLGGHLNLIVPRGATLMLDLRLERYGPISIHTALDYVVNPWLTLHGGLQRSIPELMYTLDMFFTEAELAVGHWDLINAGCTIQAEKWTLNYALAWLTENQGMRHQISLGYFL